MLRNTAKLRSDTGCTGLPYGSVETGEIRDLTGHG